MGRSASPSRRARALSVVLVTLSLLCFALVPTPSLADNNKIFDANDRGKEYIAKMKSRNLPAEANWVSFDEALKNAKTNLKPILVFFAQPWCEACKKFKQTLKKYYTSEFVEMSKRFNVVNVEDDADMPRKLAEAKFSLDGQYYPRMFLLDPYGKIDVSLKGVFDDELENQYAYESPKDLLRNMAKLAERWEPVQPKEDL